MRMDQIFFQKPDSLRARLVFGFKKSLALLVNGRKKLGKMPHQHAYDFKIHIPFSAEIIRYGGMVYVCLLGNVPSAGTVNGTKSKLIDGGKRNDAGVSWEFSATSKFMSLYSSPFKIIDVNQMVKPNECQAFFRKNLDIAKKIARFKFLQNENCPMV